MEFDLIKADHDRLYFALKSLLASLDFDTPAQTRLRAKNKAQRAISGVTYVPPYSRVRKVQS